MKRILLIVSVMLCAIVVQAQNRSLPAGDVVSGPILKFYPNPATTVIAFDFQKGYDRGYTLQIFNFLGRKMQELSNVSDHTTVDLSAFTRGVYIYQLLDKSGKIVESGKFQVSK